MRIYWHTPGTNEIETGVTIHQSSGNAAVVKTDLGERVTLPYDAFHRREEEAIGDLIVDLLRRRRNYLDPPANAGNAGRIREIEDAIVRATKRLNQILNK